MINSQLICAEFMAVCSGDCGVSSMFMGSFPSYPSIIPIWGPKVKRLNVKKMSRAISPQNSACSNFRASRSLAQLYAGLHHIRRHGGKQPQCQFFHHMQQSVRPTFADDGILQDRQLSRHHPRLFDRGAIFIVIPKTFAPVAVNAA